MTWILVPGGTCRYGDEAKPIQIGALYWTATTLTSADGMPRTGLSQADAADLAASAGGRLPRSAEWEWMAAGPDRRRHPWGDQPWDPTRANLRASGIGTPCPAGTHPAGATPDGLHDVAGNVWEWTASPAMGSGAVLRGGSFDSLPLYAQCTFLNAAPAELRSPGIGVRVVRDP